MKTVRWGLIGCGDISRKRVAPALRDAPHSELIAVSRARAPLVAHFAQEFGARKAHYDWRELIADPDVDAVYVATPVDLHAEMTIAAAEAGKHVLCEKPMALRSGQCERMIAACKDAGVKLGVAYYRRFYPVVARIRELIASGEIGTPVIAQINAFERFNPEPSEARFWLVDRARAGGGPMMDFGCHRLELLVHLFGEALLVHSFTDSLVHKKRNVEDTAFASLSFEGGPRALLTVAHAAAESQDTLDIYGSKGSLHVRALNQGDLAIVTSDGRREESHPPHANLHQPLVEDFVAALRENREPAVGGEAGLRVNRLLDAVYGL